MATIGSGTVSLNNTSRRQYVSCEPFHNDFFTYTTTTSFLNGNWEIVGSLTTVAGATKTNCPQGRVLRENGKKMYPGANPGVTTYMVGVYDDTTFLNGFINPNSPIFTPMNTDKPTYMANGADIGTYAGLQNVGTGSYTQGTIFAGDLSGAAIGIGNGFYSGIGNHFYNADLSGTVYGAIYQFGPAQASSLETDGYIAIETGTNGTISYEGGGPFDISGDGTNKYAGMYSNGTIVVVSNAEATQPGGLVNVFTNPDLSGAYASIYIPGMTFYAGPADTDLAIETGREADGVFAGLYANGTIYAVSNEDEQDNGLIGGGIINAFTNPDLSGAYASMYTYRNEANEPNSRMANEAGNVDSGDYAGVYSDGTIEATSTTKAYGGLTVGGGTYTSSVYHGIVNFTPNVIASTGTASTIINLVGLGPSSLLFFGNTRLVDPFTIYNGFTTAASTVTIRYTHIVDGNSITSAVAWPYMIINPV